MVGPFFRSHALRLICGKRKNSRSTPQEKRRLEELEEYPFEEEEFDDEEEEEESEESDDEEEEESEDDDSYLRTHPRLIGLAGHVWKGWNAALISVKRKGRLQAALAHPAPFWLDEMGEEEIKTFKKGVDALTVHAMVNVSLVRLLKELMGYDSYRRFVESLFKSIAKFVLSVFDKEDFERICFDEDIAIQWQCFCSELCDKPVIDVEGIPTRAIRKVIGESQRFPALREHDFCEILWQCHEMAEAPTNGGVVFDLQSGLFKFKLCSVTESGGGNEVIHDEIYEVVKKGDIQEDDISESFRNKAIMEVLQNFVHLKEECKTQLALELTCANVYRVYDSLVIEALKGIETDELFKLYNADKRPRSRMLSTSDLSSVREVASIVLEQFVQALYQLGYFKSMALKYGQNALVSSLLSAFGPCEAEVMEVIRIADHERRLKSERAISLVDIKYGLLLSSVGDVLKRDDGGSPPGFSVIKLFKLARRKASNAGDREVGVEHLVLAMNSLLRREPRKDVSCVPAVRAKLLKCVKLRNVNKQQASIKEWSPVSSILHSRCRTLNEIESIKKVCDSPEDISWIREDTISLA